MKRRDFVSLAVASCVEAQDRPVVRHILPGASHDRFLIKASFGDALQAAPVLRVNDRSVIGRKTDTDGEFWAFDVLGLKPATTYNLKLFDQSWPLRTHPAPDASADRFRVLINTCAGGHDTMRIPDSDRPYWVSVEQRRQMLEAALRQRPDAAIAIGDHVYWDLRFGRGSGRLPAGDQPWSREILGSPFDRDIPVVGTPNERRVKRAVNRQVAELYGTLFRSTPISFIQDDHDYFENDEAHSGGVSFPPDDFMTRLARATQHMYYPEHLPDAWRPAGLPGASAADRGNGLSECYGTVRYGGLAELLLYDCRRFLTLKGPHATFVPENTEAWLVSRMKTSPARHVVNVPSMPVGWTAGKWGEWYPDVLDDSGRLTTAREKYFWQPGWRTQHDRLLTAASSMRRIPLFLSGDLHALAHAQIVRNGKQDLSANPVHTVLTGPLSTGPMGWPSSARGTPPLTASGIELREDLNPLEWNGFTLIDFTPQAIQFKMYRWKMGQPETALTKLEPFHEFRIAAQNA